MLFPPESLKQRIVDAKREIVDRHLEATEAAHLLLAVDPEDAPSYLILGSVQTEAGDLAEAERLYWKALEIQPFGCLYYISLAHVYGRLGPSAQAAGHAVWYMGLWAAGMSEKVPSAYADLVRQMHPDLDVDFEDPETYCEIAGAREMPWRGDAMDADLSRRMRPCWLLMELARGVHDGLTEEMLREIRGEAATCLPVWRAVVRAWARSWEDTDDEVLMMVLALLGEHAGPELLGDLWELSNLQTRSLFLHAHWALCRMAVRYPSETVASVHAAIPTTPTGGRCSMAEHLSLMRGVEGVEAALLALVQDFADHATHQDAPYLLLAVGNALEATGHAPRAKELYARLERSLTKDGRAWFREMLESDEGFEPYIVVEGVPDLSIEEVCLESALVESDDEDDEFDDDEFDEEEVSQPKPGRNDPCWCGSGKKYKKCHLQSDEAQEQEDPARGEAMSELLGTVEKLYKRRAMMLAAREYFDQDISDLSQMEQESEGFLIWLLFDFRAEPGARTAVEEHLRRHGGHTKREVREVLEAWRDSRYGLFELGPMQFGDGRELKDVYAGDTVVLTEPTDLKHHKPGEHVLARIEQWGGTVDLSETAIPVPPGKVAALRAFIEAESAQSGQTPAVFIRANTHRLHRILRDL